MYIIRLDDASELMDEKKWNRVEEILDKYNVKPIVGIIPKNEDPMFNKYKKNKDFWSRARKWQQKGWIIALHGYEHRYVTKNAGINPVHKRSEFAGLNINIQREKIKKGYLILGNHKIKPEVFFAPSHTFDKNTVKALKMETNIRIISDTIANDVYFYDDFYYIPQQSGRVRKLPFKTTTFCYHPNFMSDSEFIKLDAFIEKNKNKFQKYKLKKRRKNLYDILLGKLYFILRKLKKIFLMVGRK